MALLAVTISKHSSADLPVVITSSTTRTFEFFFILKPLLKRSLPFILSANIVSMFSCLPTSYPTITPPSAGDKIISQMKIIIETFSEDKLPLDLKKISPIKPGSRNLSK